MYPPCIILIYCELLLYVIILYHTQATPVVDNFTVFVRVGDWGSRVTSPSVFVTLLPSTVKTARHN